MSWLKKFHSKPKLRETDDAADQAHKVHNDASKPPYATTSPQKSHISIPVGSNTTNTVSPIQVQKPSVSYSSSSSSPTGNDEVGRGIAQISNDLAALNLKNVRPSQTGATIPSGPASKAMSGSLHIRVMEGRDVSIYNRKSLNAPEGSHESSQSHSSSATENPYVVLSYDKNEVVVNSSGGSLTAPLWRNKATFDLTHDANLVISLFFRVIDSSQSKADAAQKAEAETNQNAGESGNVSSSMATDVLIGFTIIEAAKLPRAASDIQDAWIPLTLSSQVTAQVHLQLMYRAPAVQAKGLSIDDFDLLKVLGKGSFGKVMQVRKKDTGRIYAMKILKKAQIVSREEVIHTISERNVLMTLRHPFIVNLKFAFQNSQKLYLVLPFINGGELFKHLSQEGSFEEERSRFYAAEMVLALECLHSYNIIYRDLKPGTTAAQTGPENILLDYSGHIALCDFGLCKLNMDETARTNTFCGTPEYLAVEVLLGSGYNKSVDWWTLGILLFEMLTGLPPFYDENVNDMYRKILYSPLVIPATLSATAGSLLKGLIERDSDARLGSKNGAADIKSHAFFSQIDWKMLYDRKITPPFKPSVTGALDTSNFDDEFTSEVPFDSVVTDSVLSQTFQGQFAGFTFIPSNDLSAAAKGNN